MLSNYQSTFFDGFLTFLHLFLFFLFFQKNNIKHSAIALL